MTSHEQKNEVPPWMLAKIDQRVAEVKHRAGEIVALGGFDMLLVMLSEPPEDATQLEIDRWDQTCDGCGAYVPGRLRTGHALRMLTEGVRITLTFGVCSRCGGFE